MSADPATAAWSVNRRAALAVVWQLRHRPSSESRELLEALGVVQPGGHELLPDDTRLIRVDGLGGSIQASEAVHVAAESKRNPETLTSPPALRVLPPVTEPAKGKRTRRAAAKTESTRRPARKAPERDPGRQRKAVAECGTPSGYQRHRDAKETPCESCKDAQRAYQRAYAARRRPEGWQPRKVAVCGTVSGYSKHLRAGETPCQACKDAQAAKTRERYYRNHPDAKPRTPAQCGTIAGYTAHRRKRETPCQACKDASNGYHRARYAQQQRVVPQVPTEATSDVSPVTGNSLAPTGPTQLPPSTAAFAVDLDVWFADAQRSDHPPVRRAAAVAVSAFMALRIAMDDLARAERAASPARAQTGAS